MISRYSLIYLLIIFLVGCNAASPSATPAPVTEATLTPQPSVTTAPSALRDYVTRIRNAQYQLGATDSLRIVQLTDGKFEQGAPVVPITFPQL